MESSIDNRLKALIQISQEKLANLLMRIPGKKDLIIDQNLMKPLERISGVKFLRSNGVDKIFKFETSGVRCVNSQWVYFVLADLITVKCISDQINADLQASHHNNNYHLILVPCNLASIQHLLEEDGIYGEVTVYNFSWELFHLDSSVLSLELPVMFKMIYVQGDFSFLSVIARSLWTLQMLCGKIPFVMALGQFSNRIYNMITVMFDELGSPDVPDYEIGHLLVVDRDIDYASVLLTPVTYTGLLDEVFGVNGGTVDLDSRVTKNSGSINFQLNAADGIYNEIKHRHFSDVFSFLSAKTKELQSEFNRSSKMALQEMKQYVSTELKGITSSKRSLAYHIGACEVIIGEMGHRFESLHKVEQNMLENRNKRESLNYIEESITLHGKNEALKLMSLMTLAQDGFTQEDAMQLKTQFLQANGFEHLSVFFNLEKLSLFTRQISGSVSVSDVTGKLADRVSQVVSLPKRNAFQINASKLKLFPNVQDDYDLKNPNDMGYVFSGSYIPLVCRLLQMIIKREIPLSEIVKLIPSQATFNGNADNSSVKSNTFLVYFIGGVTYAEIAAFNLLEKMTGVKIIVAGTSIINGANIVKSCM